MNIKKYVLSVFFYIKFLDPFYSFCEEKKVNKSDNVDANASSVYQSTVDGINYVTNFCYHNPVYAVLGAVAICGGFVGLYYAFTSVGLAKSTALGVGSATLGSTTSSGTNTPIVDEKVISSIGETIGEKIIKKAVENLSVKEISSNSATAIAQNTQDVIDSALAIDLTNSALAVSTALAGFCVISYVNGNFQVSHRFERGKAPTYNLKLFSNFINSINDMKEVSFFTQNDDPNNINLVRKDEFMFRSSGINEILLDFNFDENKKLKLTPSVIKFYTSDGDFDSKNLEARTGIDLLLEKRKDLFYSYKDKNMNRNQVVAVWNLFLKLKLCAGNYTDLIPTKVYELGQYACGNNFWKYNFENDYWNFFQEEEKKKQVKKDY